LTADHRPQQKQRPPHGQQQRNKPSNFSPGVNISEAFFSIYALAFKAGSIFTLASMFSPIKYFVVKPGT
jgi:hypothetical protein